MNDPKPTFSYLVSKIKDLHTDLAYLHLVEPRVNNNEERDPSEIGSHESNDFIRAIWSPSPIISAGGYTRETAIQVAQEKGDIVAFGRHFISNVRVPPSTDSMKHIYDLMCMCTILLLFSPTCQSDWSKAYR